MKTSSGWICSSGDILSTPGLDGKNTVIGRIMVFPKDVHVRIPGICDYVALHGKREFAEEIKLRILRYRDYPGLSK